MKGRYLELVGIFTAALVISLIITYTTGKEITSFEPETNLVEPCFTPGDHCDAFIADAIDTARTELLVQAYHLTNKKIINAMCFAKFRGVNVTLIVDKAAKKELLKIPRTCFNATYIDHKKVIAHNKVIVIDGEAVFTGSYNFTEAAENRNVENVSLIKIPATAQQYRDNFFNRVKESAEYK